MLKKSCFRVLTCLIVTICILASTGFSMDVNDPNEILQKRLTEISAKNKGKVADLTKVETDCIALIVDYNSPAQKGMIYAEIAKAYSKKGFDGRNDIRTTKTISYCQKALEQPLDVITACEMHGRLTDSMIVSFRTLPHSQFVELRQEAIVSCLNGLNIAIDNNAPLILPQPPVVGRYNVTPDHPDYDELMNKYQEELATRKKWEFESKLYFQRQVLTELCVSLYSHEPYDISEFRQFSQNILVNHTEVIDELADKIRDRISSK